MDRGEEQAPSLSLSLSLDVWANNLNGHAHSTPFSLSLWLQPRPLWSGEFRGVARDDIDYESVWLLTIQFILMAFSLQKSPQMS